MELSQSQQAALIDITLDLAVISALAHPGGLRRTIHGPQFPRCNTYLDTFAPVLLVF